MARCVHSPKLYMSIGILYIITSERVGLVLPSRANLENTISFAPQNRPYTAMPFAGRLHHSMITEAHSGKSSGFNVTCIKLLDQRYIVLGRQTMGRSAVAKRK